MTRHVRPLIAGLVAAALLAPALPARADEDTVRCESRDYRYRYCRADTDSRVTLVRELSKRRCQIWSDWGYDKRGVWVDNGCRAEFRVGRSGLSGGQAAAVGGAVAGAVILGAILASRSDKHEDVPDWAPGVYRGYDSGWRGEVELTIHNASAVEGFVVDRDDRFTGRFDRDRLFLGPDEFRVTRDGNGFRAKHTRDSGREIQFKRVR